MGLFDSLFGKKQEAPTLRDTLFGDLPLEQWPPPGAGSTEFPWSAFASARTDLAAGRTEAAVAAWRQIVARPGLESRHYLQAWHFLKQQRQPPPADAAKRVLGVIVEVALDQGLDLLAAYPDHSARYYNYSGAGVVWEHPDRSLDGPIDDLLAAAADVVAEIGPWEEARPGPPARGQARLSFLTPSGLHFGQASLPSLSNDPLGAKVLRLATALMQALTAKTRP